MTFGDPDVFIDLDIYYFDVNVQFSIHPVSSKSKFGHFRKTHFFIGLGGVISADLSVISFYLLQTIVIISAFENPLSVDL